MSCWKWGRQQQVTLEVISWLSTVHYMQWQRHYASCKVLDKVMPMNIKHLDLGTPTGQRPFRKWSCKLKRKVGRYETYRVETERSKRQTLRIVDVFQVIHIRHGCNPHQMLFDVPAQITWHLRQEVEKRLPAWITSCLGHRNPLCLLYAQTNVCAKTRKWNFRVQICPTKYWLAVLFLGLVKRFLLLLIIRMSKRSTQNIEHKQTSKHGVHHSCMCDWLMPGYTG